MTRYLSSRLSSLRYDAARDCTPSTRMTHDKKSLRSTLLHLDGICEYCRVNKATTKDHFYPVIMGGYPSEYCNDYWNLVPCCKECNSSKGGKIWNVWLASACKGNPMLTKTEKEKTEIMERLTNYDKVMNEHCQKKEISREKFDEIMNPLQEALEKAQKQIQLLMLNEA